MLDTEKSSVSLWFSPRKDRNIMKKLLTIMMLILLAGCSLNNKEDEIHPDGGICAPNIMVNDRHYHTTGLAGEEYMKLMAL